jgi:hypothetical protein
VTNGASGEAGCLRDRTAHKDEEKRGFFQSTRGMWAIRRSVDFVDGSGNKRPRTVRSQIVPHPVLTVSATQASALLRHLIDLLSFSIEWLIRPLHLSFLGNALAIVVPLSLSGSFRGAGSSIRLSLKREAAAFICQFGCEGWCRLHRCRKGASDDQNQRAQLSQNRRHGTPHRGGAILGGRRCIAASPVDAIPLGGVSRSSNNTPKPMQS